MQCTKVDQKKGRTACRIHWLALNRNTAAPKYSFTRKSLTDTNYEIQHQFPMTACVLNSYDLRLQQIIFGHFATSAGRLFLLLFILHRICQYLYIHVFLCICVFLYLCICDFATSAGRFSLLRCFAFHPTLNSSVKQISLLPLQHFHYVVDFTLFLSVHFFITHSNEICSVLNLISVHSFRVVYAFCIVLQR